MGAHNRDPAAGIRSMAPADPSRNGLPAASGYVYRGTGSALCPEDAAAYVRLRSLRRYAIAEDAPLADSLMAPPEVHRERQEEDVRALLATSREDRAAVPAGPPEPEPAPEPAEPEWCDGCGYRTHRCCCTGGPRGGAR